MPQIFHRSTNTLSKLSIFGAAFIVAALAWAFGVLLRSPYATQADVAREQPVPFSHAHHVGGLGIDCRYCHTTVETSSFAGIPPSQTCMNCHAQIWSLSPTLEPVRRSFKTDEPIAWTRVNDLPDFVYFHHAIHVAKGIGCVTCHGRVDRMELTWAEHPLTMEWCLDCHRAPEKHVRPRERVFDLAWRPPEAKEEAEVLGRDLVSRYGIKKMTNCSVCHR